MVFGFGFANKGAASILQQDLDDASSNSSDDRSSTTENIVAFDDAPDAVLDASTLSSSSIEPAKLQANLLTKIASDYKEANTHSTVATNDTFISYGLKQGHIRVLHRYSEARALLKGHTSPIASLTFLSSHVIASGGQDGKVFVWELKEGEDENALGVECIMRAVFSPGCDNSDVFLARAPLAVGNSHMVATVGSSVMMIDLNAVRGTVGDAESEALLDIDPLDPAPYGSRLAGFPLQDTPTCVSTSKRGVLAVGSKRGRVYVAQLGAGGSVVGRVVAVDVVSIDHSEVCGVDWLGSNTLVASVQEGRKKVLYEWDGASALEEMDSMTLKDSDRKDPYVHTSVVAKRRLACLADTRNNAVYVVRVGKERFTSAAVFKVGKPILSMFACWNMEAGKLELTCVQTDAITQYYVDDGGVSEEEDGEEAAMAAVAAVAEQVEALAMEETADDADNEEEPDDGAEETTADETADEAATQESAALNTVEEQSLNPPFTALSVSDGRQSENVEDFSLMSALLTPSDIMSTAEIKSTDSSKREAKEAREPEATKPAVSEKAAKKKKSKKEAPVPVPIKVLKRDESQSASPVNADQISLSDDNEDNLDLENNDGEFLVNAGASSAAIIAAIRKQNALQNKMIEKALKEHRQYVDGQISRALNDVEKKSAANKKAMEASLQTAVKDSIRTILPKEVFGAVKTGLDKQLATAVQQGLSKSLQDSFKHSFMKQLVPAFEAACQNMLTQFDGTLKQHLNEVTKEAKDSLSAVAKAAASAARPAASSHGHSQPQSPHSVQSMTSPKEEIQNLLRSGNLEQAFRKALSLQDLGILGWLCASVDAPSTLARTPAPLSQMVLLSLLQQLAHDLSQQTTSKLQWIREAAMNINPTDQSISHQVKPVLQGVLTSLNNNMAKMSPADASNCKLTIHIVRSQMVG